jgi:hypothetical protein
VSRIIQTRTWWSVCFSIPVGVAGMLSWPFPKDNALLQLVLLEKPALFYALKYAYLTMLFSTPFVAFSTVLSVLYIFFAHRSKESGQIRLPRYPEIEGRDRLYLVIGEVHHAKKPEPVENPRWLVIPDRGLFTGIAIFGAIGTGKTTGCMYPFAKQLLSFRSRDKERRVGGLILEVKGDFCYHVKRILETAGRAEDYVEISLDSPYRYNPLHNDLDAYALAYGIASLLNNLFGKSKEPFWQQAYTNLVKFIILLHKILYDYVTLFDVYECAINPDRLEEKIRNGEASLPEQFILITVEAFMAERELETYPFERDPESGQMKAPLTEDLLTCLRGHNIAVEAQTHSPTADTPKWALDSEKRQQFDAVKRWFYEDWKRVEPRLKTSIVEGISVFLSLFDDNPAVKRTFCPPKEAYDPVANHDGRLGKPLPPLAELLEQGAVLALNLPIATNPGLAKTIRTLLKQDFERAVLNRIPRMAQEPSRMWRELLFLCDEYQGFATVGENDPSGDEKFFALSRQAKCIPIVATQSISSLRSTLPGESWRTLVQTFRTKIFLALSDDFSARTASDLCGKEEQLKPNYTISETGQDAQVSMLTGRAVAHRATLSTTKGYTVQRDFTFEPKVFSELKNAQAIVLAYDGSNPHPPSFCYLKPYYLDQNISYFEQLAKGAI